MLLMREYGGLAPRTSKYGGHDTETGLPHPLRGHEGVTERRWYVGTVARSPVSIATPYETRSLVDNANLPISNTLLRRLNSFQKQLLNFLNYP
jgi:hypothetical protein